MPVFTAGGLATGMDTNSIVEQLVSLESRPLSLLRSRQSGMKTQVSTLADLVSKLSSLAAAAKDLGDAGVLGTKAVSTNDAFTATPGSAATAGRYGVEVTALARAAKWRSAAFAAGATHAGGTLTLTVQGVTYPPPPAQPIAIADRASLADVAAQIRALGAPVTATVLSDGTRSYLSITARDTGHPVAGGAAAALSVAFTPTGTPAGQLPAYAEIEGARNATFEIDGLAFTRPSNTVSDALPGVTLTLRKEGAPAEDLVVANDPDATKARLQKFVDAYNAVMAVVQKQLSPAEGSSRSASLQGDAAVRGLQRRLQALVVAAVPGLGTTSTLADLGVKTARDGSLSVDAATLDKAVARDPAAVNGLFSKATTGLSALAADLASAYTRAGDGVLVARQKGLDESIKSLDRQAEAMSKRIEAFRTNLLRQFAAMEEAVSGYKSIGDFLTRQTAQTAK
jgi:flagellar hook-associated protein 2